MNSFKEGDLVNVYGLQYPGSDLSKPTSAIVGCNWTDDDEIVHLELFDVEDKVMGFAKAHYKQCELIAKERHCSKCGLDTQEFENG